jgi:hypothetical protein
MLLAALATLTALTALVVQDQTPLRASAHETAPRQTTLTSGDWLEVRGEQQGYLQVYDHRRERPGYVRPAAVRTYAVDEASAPKLAAIVDFLKDAPGQESLGIAYAALYLRAAPASAVGAETLDAIGTMADRLARRASARVARGKDASLAEQLDVVESYGVRFVRFEVPDRDGRTRVCYDGEAFRRVLALGGAGRARVRAALGLTDPSCVDPSLGWTAALALAKWQASVLVAVDPSSLGTDVPASERARLRLRRTSVQAGLAYYAARAGDWTLAAQASESARRELQLADRSTLADDDRLAYDEAALRAASVRWGSEPVPGAERLSPPGWDLAIGAGAPGETCVRLTRRAPQQAPPFEHCTYAVVWPSSIRVAPRGAAIAMVVQPLVGWSELLLLRPAEANWGAATVTPAAVDPELGYVEPAGFSPDGAHLLVAREARASGPLGSPDTLAPRIDRSFQVLATGDLRVEKQGTSLAGFPSFRRWQSADWQRGTLALR